MKSILVKEIFRPARRNFPRRKMSVRGLNEHWSADLMDMKSYARKNKGYKFILLVVDSLSKMIFCEPLLKKDAANVYDGFVKIFQRSKVYPKNLHTDSGKEFYNKKVQDLFKEHNVNHYSTFSIIKSSFAERAIRTIKEKIFKNFALRDNDIYHDKLQKIVNDYNRSVHSTIKCRPIDVDEKIAKKLMKTVFYEPIVKFKKPKFKVGECVRISKQKEFFEKGYTSRWRKEIFKVKKINYSTPITYEIEDLMGDTIQGLFYEQELAKTDFCNL